MDAVERRRSQVVWAPAWRRSSRRVRVGRSSSPGRLPAAAIAPGRIRQSLDRFRHHRARCPTVPPGACAAAPFTRPRV